MIQANATNRDEYLRVRRGLLAYYPQLAEYHALKAIFDDVLNHRITAEEAERRAGGRSPQEIIQRMVELHEVVRRAIKITKGVKHKTNAPLDRKARVESALNIEQNGTISRKTEAALSQMRRS